MAAPLLEDLTRETDNFFARHWVSASIGTGPPRWQRVPCFPAFVGDIPNFSSGGCYALFEGQMAAYIGLGASCGQQRYPEHGSGRRLLGHVLRRTGRQTYAIHEQWPFVTELFTIGFGSDLTYLALALEDYLIGKLNTSRNNNKRRRSNTVSQ